MTLYVSSDSLHKNIFSVCNYTNKTKVFISSVSLFLLFVGLCCLKYFTYNASTNVVFSLFVLQVCTPVILEFQPVPILNLWGCWQQCAELTTPGTRSTEIMYADPLTFKLYTRKQQTDSNCVSVRPLKYPLCQMPNFISQYHVWTLLQEEEEF